VYLAGRFFYGDWTSVGVLDSSKLVCTVFENEAKLNGAINVLTDNLDIIDQANQAQPEFSDSGNIRMVYLP
jgi:hypothetical protein